MPSPRSWKPRAAVAASLAQGFAFAAVIGILGGTASAFFLFGLEWVTDVRLAHPWLIALLPLAGFAVAWVYLVHGNGSDAGNNLIIDEIHDPKKAVPLRMAPLVLAGTWISHLFGASVGREGTAVQMGGALADQLSRLFKRSPFDRRLFLMAGMSAGFASVFGTPLAGALFGLEVLAIGRLRTDALLPCVTAAVVADRVALLWGVHHTAYPIPEFPSVTLLVLISVVLAGLCFGGAGRLFAAAVHGGTAAFRRLVPYAPLRALAGGAVIALACFLFSAQRYAGLGIPGIVAAFHGPVPAYDFAAKGGFTIAALVSGFKGGEVTPLFYIGATLGNALAPLLHLPFAFVAGLGFVAVFAGAANVPIACTVMAMELFGSGIGLFAGIACVASYLVSGHAGIYRAQRIGEPKHPVRDR